MAKMVRGYKREEDGTSLYQRCVVRSNPITHVHEDNVVVLKLREPSPLPLAADIKSRFKMYADINLSNSSRENCDRCLVPRNCDRCLVPRMVLECARYLLALFSFCCHTQLVFGGMLWVSPRPTRPLPCFANIPACSRAGKNPTGFG